MRPADHPAQRIVYCPAVLLASALTAGVVGDRYCDAALLGWSVSLVTFLLAWLMLWSLRHERTGSCVLLLAVAAFGGLLHHVHWNLYRVTDLSLMLRPERQPVALSVTVSDYPRWIPEQPPRSPYEFAVPAQWKVPIKINHLRNGRNWIPATGFAEVYVAADAVSTRPGQSLTLFAQASCPERVLNPGEFNFDRWARGNRQRIYLRAGFTECLQTQAGPNQAFIWRPIQELRRYTAETISMAVPAESHGLAETIFLGRRERLADETNDAFRQTGTVHLLALSGLHLGILAFLSLRLLRWLPGPIWLPGSAMLVLTLTYLLLVDARPPIIRASILVILYCGGQIFLRRHSFWNSLAVAWIVILCWNPTEIFQAGTQLSFLAVAALAWLNVASQRFTQSDPLQNLINQSRPWPVRSAKRMGREVANWFLASGVVWLVTVPLVLVHFHAISPWTVVLTPLLILPMSFALGGIVALLFGSVLPGVPLPWLSDLIGKPLWLLENIVAVTHDRWGFTYWTSGPAWWWVIGFYALVGVLGWRMVCGHFPRRWAMAGIALWCGLGFATGLYQEWQALQRNEVVCTFVSVGHGTCVLLELPGGQNLLYDCGRLGSPNRAAQSLSAILWGKGLSHLDAVIISHDDADHFNGLPGILERFSVGTVYCSAPMQTLPGPLVEHLLQELDVQSIPIRTISAGQRLSTREDVDLMVIHPTRKGVLGSDNANSIVLMVEYGGRRILLPGDLESPGTEAVLLEQPIQCDVVMAPHHGSRHSNPEAFYAWCRPQWIIVSSGSREVTAQVEGAGPADHAQWRITAADGRIEVRLGAQPGADPKVTSFWGD